MAAGLSDYLLAIRALLDRGDPSPDGLAHRLGGAAAGRHHVSPSARVAATNGESTRMGNWLSRGLDATAYVTALLWISVFIVPTAFTWIDRARRGWLGHAIGRAVGQGVPIRGSRQRRRTCRGRSGRRRRRWGGSVGSPRSFGPHRSGDDGHDRQDGHRRDGQPGPPPRANDPQHSGPAACRSGYASARGRLADPVTLRTDGSLAATGRLLSSPPWQPAPIGQVPGACRGTAGVLSRSRPSAPPSAPSGWP